MCFLDALTGGSSIAPAITPAAIGPGVRLMIERGRAMGRTLAGTNGRRGHYGVNGRGRVVLTHRGRIARALAALGAPIALGVVIVAGTGLPDAQGTSWAPVGVERCATEDSIGPCVWRGAADGNGSGRSFYVAPWYGTSEASGRAAEGSGGVGGRETCHRETDTLGTPLGAAGADPLRVLYAGGSPGCLPLVVMYGEAE